MCTMTRRSFLLGTAATAAIAAAPGNALAGQLLDADVMDPTADLDHLSKLAGFQVTEASRWLHNRHTGEAAMLLRGGQQWAWLYRADPGAFVPFAHRHDEAEIYQVISGKIDVCIDGQWQTAQAGETVVIPAMAMHEARNPYTESVLVLVTFDPGTEDTFLAGKAYWTACEQGLYNRKGVVRMNHVLGEVAHLDSRVYPRGIPRWLVDLAYSVRR